MSIWLEYIRVFWPVFLGAGTFVMLFGLLWLRSKFTPIEEHKAVAKRVTDLESLTTGQDQRIAHVEGAMEQAPTRQELQDDIGELASRMTGVETGLQGIDARLKTQNDYLHLLVEKGLRTGGQS